MRYKQDTLDSTLRQHNTLNDIFFPIDCDRFLSEYWGKSFLRVVGEHGRLSSLISWADIKAVLERHQLQPPQINLFQDGRAIDPSYYQEHRRGRVTIKGPSLVQHMSRGATLVINEVDEIFPQLRSIAEQFQSVLKTHCTINLYASWCDQNGFKLHWDAQDTIILQARGRKRWSVFKPTRLFPLRDDIEPAEPPSDEPVWDGILNDGSVLYIPRGWWHIVFPVNEPSIHLTVTIVRPTGVDFLQWLVRQTRSSVQARSDMPQTLASDTQAYIEDIQQMLIQACTPDMLAKFIADQNGKSYVRPSVHFPFEDEDGTLVTRDTIVRILSPISVDSSDPRQSVLFGGGVRWRCSAAVLPAVQILIRGGRISVQQLCETISSTSDHSELTVLIAGMALAGIVAIEN